MRVGTITRGLGLAVSAAYLATPVFATQDVSEASCHQWTCSEWTWPPFIIAPLIFVAAVYVTGLFKMSLRRQRRLRPGDAACPVPKIALRRFIRLQRLPVPLLSAICFVAGWLSLIFALDSPLHEIGEQLFWVHMTQHEILMLISAPLLVLGRPAVPILWSLPVSWRNVAAHMSHLSPLRQIWTFVSSPIITWLLAAVALLLWHAPALFNRTLEDNFVHAAQHMSFLGSALLFWWNLTEHGHRLGHGTGVLYVFTTAIYTSVLGALLTFASHPWYSAYVHTTAAWGLTQLEDQQVGGLIMWIPGGTVMLIISLLLLVRWMKESQRRWGYTRTAELILSSARIGAGHEN